MVSHEIEYLNCMSVINEIDNSCKKGICSRCLEDEWLDEYGICFGCREDEENDD